MKRTFSAKRNALLSSVRLSWGTYVLGAALFLLLVRSFAPDLFWSVFTPVFRASDSLAERSHVFLSSFGDAAALTLHNERLADENAALALENKALQEKIDGIAGLGSGAQGIAVGVVARPPVSPYDTLVLAGGSAEGVTSGMEAFGEGGVPLGIVSSVSEHFSRVTLFSAPGASVGGSVGRAHLPLMLTGKGAGVLAASASRSAAIAVGDVVFAPGPGWLPVGSVVRIDSDPSSPAVSLQIAPALNPFSLSFVLLRDTGAAFLHRESSTVPTTP